jgi:hypothetical protein
VDVAVARTIPTICILGESREIVASGILIAVVSLAAEVLKVFLGLVVVVHEIYLFPFSEW